MDFRLVRRLGHFLAVAEEGHFGRAADKDGGFSWEKTDLVKALKAAVK